MKKLLLPLMVFLAAMLLCTSSLAESYTFTSIKATVEMSDDYIVLTPDNLKSYEDWLTSRETTLEQTQKDFEDRGVLLQGWTSDDSACFEITAIQTETSQGIFDVNEQSETVRATYRKSFFPNNDYEAEGYEYLSSDWKRTDNGRYLILKYNFRENGELVYRAYARRTIRNGYEICLAMKVYGRSLAGTDNAALNRLWNTFSYTEILPMSAQASAKLSLTSTPPAETCEASFTLTGTAAQGLELTAVAMGLNSPDPTVFTYTVGKNGKVKMPITLPKEGVFLITLTGKIGGVDALELAYPVTYQRTLLAVDIKTEIPDQVTTDEFRLSGTSVPGASAQLIVNGKNYKKKVAANTKWFFDIDTSEEGTYDVVLVFAKKGLVDRRFTYSFSRQWTDEDMLKQMSKSAIKPAYDKLIANVDKYVDRVMTYRAYVLSVSESGAKWSVQMALNKKGDDYANLLIVSSQDKPSVAQGERVRLYGKFTGMSSPVSNEDGTTGASYPCFDLMLFEGLE